MRHDLQKAAAELAMNRPMRFLQPGASVMGGEPKGIPVRLHRALTEMACASLDLEGSADFILELGTLDFRDAGIHVLKEHLIDRGWRREGLWRRHELSGFVPHRLLVGWGVAGAVCGLYAVESRRREFKRGERKYVELTGCKKESPVDEILHMALQETGELQTWENGSFHLASPMLYGFDITHDRGVTQVSFDPAVAR